MNRKFQHSRKDKFSPWIQKNSKLESRPFGLPDPFAHPAPLGPLETRAFEPPVDHQTPSLSGQALQTEKGYSAAVGFDLTHVPVLPPELVDTNTISSNSPTIQRDLAGADPVADSDVLDPTHVHDLLYGLANYRGLTMTRMAEPRTQKRTVDQYNEAVGIDGNIINGHLACVGLYLVRNALENPRTWQTHLTGSQVNYPNDPDLLAYMQGGGALSNEQKWMTFLVRDRKNIGLWDLGDTHRPVIGHNFLGIEKKGEAEGLHRIKSKRRFAKNMHEDDVGAFSEADVHKMLSFELDTDAAQTYYQTLDAPKQQGLNRWIQNAFWRRTSKLGIDFATSDIGLNARVHFNLTSGVRQPGVGWQAQLWGILNDIASDQGTRKITESEWRYIQRMMEKNPDMLEKIIPYSET